MPKVKLGKETVKFLAIFDLQPLAHLASRMPPEFLLYLCNPCNSSSEALWSRIPHIAYDLTCKTPLLVQTRCISLTTELNCQCMLFC